MARQYGVRMSTGFVSVCGNREQAKDLMDALHRHRSQDEPRVVFRDRNDQEWLEDTQDG